MATTAKSTKTSTRKTAARAPARKPAVKAAPAAAKAKTAAPAKTPAAKTVKAPIAAKETPSVVVNAPQPVVAGPMMRKKELIDAVVAKSGIKKKDAKPVIEAMLEVLGSALQDGRELNLQPMGKVKVNREKKLAVGKVLITRIRQARDLPPSVVAGLEDQEAASGPDIPSAAE